ncbi:hypothetical protein CHOED_052 [Vibrio phage CHOED]|uniref:hypothetical protein n=1 Tax=Vibrio phage CHOED TaxID=1458716 RepID=UPI00042F5D6B|nr:hypothetical protein CHOED_052 [Vibrio phage CHOED]AHK11912.1 hypothetical protein CHOED_052 [Vibrio phage CHOED]
MHSTAQVEVTMKDHERRELINELTMVARISHDKQQLREQIARVVNKYIPRKENIK